MPEPCHFLNPAWGPVAIIRPTSTGLNGAVAAIQSFVDDGLFIVQKDRAFLKRGVPGGGGGRRRSPGARIRLAWRPPFRKDLRQLVRPGGIQSKLGPLLGF